MAVALVGDFNEWKQDDLYLEQEDNGNWAVSTAGLGAGDAYQFAITMADVEVNLRPDPRARSMTDSVGSSQI